MKEAAIRHVPLTVVTVHEVAVNGWTGQLIILPMDQPEVDKARQAAQEAVAKAAAQLGERVACHAHCPAVVGPGPR